MKAIKFIKQLADEYTFNKRNIFDWVKEDIKVNVSNKLTDKLLKAIYATEDYCKDKKELHSFTQWEIVHELLTIIIINDQTTIQTIVGNLASFFGLEDKYLSYDYAAGLVIKLADTDLYDILVKNNTYIVKSNVSITKETKLKIERVRYLPPMLIKPLKLTSVYDSPYLSSDYNPLLGKHTKRYKGLSLDVINKLNSIELSLDTNITDLDEEPTKPLKYKRDKSTFADMVIITKDEVKRILDYGNSFYHTWSYDKRGRMYSNGYYINFQGSKYKRACISLKHKKPIKGVPQ